METKGTSRGDRASALDAVLEGLRSPEAKWRIQPFWFWNGELDDAEIVRQIEEMAAQGVGGFFVCARQGMTVPYLSDAWFGKVRVAVQAAKELGLDVWLYDEYPYPSGMAGGEVILEHPDAKQRLLAHETFAVSGGERCVRELPWGKVLSARAVPIDDGGARRWDEAIDVRRYIGNHQVQPVFQKTGLTAYNQKRFFTYQTAQKLHWTPPAGEWEIHVFLEEEIEDFKYYGTFVDPCHKEAMETFIRLTHDRYAEELGDYFGHPIKGMFTDEIAPLGRVPWSPRLPEAFRARSGYELTDHLHALVGCGEAPGGVPAARVRYDFYQTVHELLRASYHEPVAAWCDRYGLEFVTEVPSVRMTTQKFSHVPGGDSAHEKIGRSLDWILNAYTANLRANPKMVSSLSVQYGRERALIECFHSVGWSMTLQDAKWMIDRMAAMGINFFNFHAFFYTLDGMTQHDAPPSQFDQNPYWAHFRKLGDYTGRISKAMGTGRAARRIAVLDPVTTLWTMMANPLHRYDYAGCSEAERAKLDALKAYWIDVCKTLLRARRDYDHLDPETLAEEGRVADGALQVGLASYKLVVLPPMANLESRAWDVLRRFMESGGQVIALGMLPHEPIEGDDRVARELRGAFGLASGAASAAGFWDGGEDEATAVSASGSAAFIGGGPALSERARRELLRLLDERLPEPIRLEAEADVFLMQRRELAPGVRAAFVSNQEGGSHRAVLAIDADGGEPPAVYAADLETGELRRLEAFAREGGGVKVPVAFAPYESRFLVVAQGERAAEAAPAADLTAELALPAAGPWRVSVARRNAVRFDAFDITIRRPGFGTLTERPFRAGAKTFIDQLEDATAAGVALPLSFEQPFGTPVRASVAYPLQVVYEAAFRVETMPASCALLMDRSAIGGDWRIAVNDNVLTAADLAPERFYDNSNVSCDVRPWLTEGDNKLTIEVDVRRDWEGVTDAIYLIGPFGVAFDDPQTPVLAAPPSTAELKAGPYPGLPYYAGDIFFTRTFALERGQLPAAGRFRLTFADLDPDFHDCAAVSVNGRPLGVRAWTPYAWEGDADALREGSNTIEVTVSNTLIGLLEGKYFDKTAHALYPVTEHPLFRRDGARRRTEEERRS